MTIPKMQAAIEHERRDADETLAKYEETNTDGAGISSTADMHVRDALLAVFVLPVWLIVWAFSKFLRLFRKWR